VTQTPGSQFYADAENVTLKYTDAFLLVQSASAGTLAALEYKLNSIYNVNIQSGTGVPQGYAELAAKYQKLHVMSSKISWRIRAALPGAPYGSLGNLGVAPTQSALFSAVMYPLQSGATPATSVLSAAVQKYACKRFDWPRLSVTSGIAWEASNPAFTWKGTKSMSAAKLDADFDAKQAVYSASFTGDPANLMHWEFAFQDILSDTSAEGVWFCEVDIWYTIRAFDRLVVADALEARSLHALSAGVILRQLPSPEAKEEKDSPVLVPRPRLKS
jgi:hypothetical protein